jgi:DNA-directed RNA polymerase subunit RPC12/RpoP
MPLRVSCPSCSKELNAPDALIGQLVACPRCSHKFQVSGVPDNVPAGVGAPVPPAAPHPPNQSDANLLPPRAADSAQVLPPPPASGGANSSTANLERISLGPLPTAQPKSAEQPPASQQTSVGSPQLPPSGAATFKTLPPQAPPAEVQNAPTTGNAPPNTASAPATPKVAKFKGAPAPADPPPEKPAKKKREVKQAKFVASGAVATRINLGEDGQLPNLVVADTQEVIVVDEEGSSTSPLLMIGVLVFSVLMSVFMLLAPESSDESESTSKQDAIEHLQVNYIGTGPELKPYQKLLRDGLQAQRRGDAKAARTAYRSVLGMLRAETSSEMGLTAPKWADPTTAPNDTDLEKHLNILLADD